MVRVYIIIHTIAESSLCEDSAIVGQKTYILQGLLTYSHKTETPGECLTYFQEKQS